MVRAEIRRLVCMETGFKPFERIAAVELLAKPFTAGDELTMTFKLRRHVIAEKHADVIASMFP
jgi:long-chain acyl-CoA synthetase